MNTPIGFAEIALICAAYLYDKSFNYSFVFLTLGIISAIFRFSYELRKNNIIDNDNDKTINKI